MRTEIPDLQASEKMLKVLKESKAHTENVLDGLPAVFAVLDKDLKILRGNQWLGRILNCSAERTLGRSLKDLFENERWSIFLREVRRLHPQTQPKVEFELPIQTSSNDVSYYFWTVSCFDFSRFEQDGLITVIGKDTTAYRLALEKLVNATKDLEIARAVQSLLLPDQDIITTSDLKLASHYHAADQTGGDWWAFNRVDDHHSIVLLGDVSGHGSGPAMVTAAMAGTYHAIHFAQQKYRVKRDVDDVCKALNHNLYQLCSGQYTMSLSIVEIFTKEKRIVLSNSGGPPIFILAPNGDVSSLVLSSMPLGSDNYSLTTKDEPIESGSRLLLFTDGAYENEDDEGNRLGRNGLRNLFQSTFGKPIETAKEMIRSRLDKYTKTADDVTFLIVDIL